VRFEIPLPPGPLYTAAISPDGRRVVGVASKGGVSSALWMRSLNAVDDEMLPGTDGATFPFWSPDSRWIAFFAGGKLKKVDTAGGQPEPIADIAGGFRGGTWHRDGFIVFASTVLRRIPASGGLPTDLTELDPSLEETFHIAPSFLPDGRHFLYLAWSDRPENRAAYIGSLNSKARTRLMAAESMAAYVPPGFVLFGRGGILMARPFDPDRLEFTGDAAPIAEGLELGQPGRGQFSVSGEGTLVYRSRGTAGPPGQRFLWKDRMGNSRGPVSGPFRSAGFRLSPDGKRVAFGEVSGASGPSTAATDLWIYDTSLDTRTKLTVDPTINHWPVWSPDGSRLVFDSSRDNKVEGHALYEKSVNGATPERLVLDPVPGRGGLGALDWSRDGQLIVFVTRKTGDTGPIGPNDLWVLPLSGDRKARPYLTTPFDEADASLSPNGRWLAYTSNESGRIKCSCNPFRIRPVTDGRFLLTEEYTPAGVVTAERSTTLIPTDGSWQWRLRPTEASRSATRQSCSRCHLGSRLSPRAQPILTM
jgi:Tol biopolymer transport system component